MQVKSGRLGDVKLRVVWVVLWLVGLSACGIQNPVIDTLMYAFPGGRQFAELRSGVEYLVVELDGKASVMALGRRHVQGEASFEDVTESWYNGQGEMLVLKNGRIQLAIGMAQEWRRNESKPPRWREVMASGAQQVWWRELDRMPGYLFDRHDEIATRRIDPPKQKPKHVSNAAVWVEDIVKSQTSQGRPWQYVQKFAVVGEQVVYSEQCISEAVCIKLQPLGVVGKP